MDLNFEEKNLNTNVIYEGKIITVHVDDIELPDGNKAIREVVEHSGGVSVAALTDEDELIFVRQYRYPYSKELLELPAGKLEKGEDPLEAAKRELEEESGVVAGTIEHIGELYTTVAILDEKIQMYLATDLTYKNAHPDDGEFLEIEKIPLSTLVDMVMKGEIKDSKTQIAILKAERILANRSKA